MEEGSGTGVPKAKLSINSPGRDDWLAILMRPMRLVVDTTPKKFGPTLPKMVNVFSKTSVGLKSEIAMFPAVGPGNASNPTAVTVPVNVRSKVSAKAFGPSTLLVLPATPAPSTTMVGPGEALY